MPIEPVYLKAIPLLRELSLSDHRELARRLELCRFDQGQAVIEQGTDSGGFFFVLEGTLQVSRQMPQDNQLNLAQIGKGHIVGYLSMIDAHVRSATVTATTPVVLAEFGREAFSAMMKSDQPLAVRFLQVLGREMIRTLRLANRRFTTAATLPPDAFLTPEHLEAQLSGNKTGF